MRSAMLLPALAAMCGAQAQQIDGYRYWFDDDLAGAQTTTVPPTNELSLAASWPTGTMEPGHHRVSYQVRDTDGVWSVPRTHYFTRGNQAITGYRYWVNDNTAAVTNGTVVPGMAVDLNALIDPGTLTKDLNRVTIQFVDADGTYGAPLTVPFTAHSGLVNGYQYWIDDAIANATSGAIGPNDVVDLLADLPTGLPAGSYTITIRFSGANGTWSVPLSSTFDSFVGIAELPGVTDLLLFPNPVTDQLGLRLNSDAHRTLQLEVLDLRGAVVADLSTWNVSGTMQRQWDISALASGSYLLRVTGEQGAWTTRFVRP
jgi:hypothetical protein